MCNLVYVLVKNIRDHCVYVAYIDHVLSGKVQLLLVMLF